MVPRLLFLCGFSESTTLSLGLLFHFFLYVLRDYVLLLSLRRRWPRTRGLRLLAHPLVDVAQAGRHTFSSILLDQSERRVLELGQCSPVGLNHAGLHIQAERVELDQSPADVKACARLDGQ